MTQTQAEKAANVVIAVAAIGAAVYVLRDPGRRRAAGRMLRQLMAAGGPWLAAQARQAWLEAGQHQAVEGRATARSSGL